jgi:hypothetical protein
MKTRNREASPCRGKITLAGSVGAPAMRAGRIQFAALSLCIDCAITGEAVLAIAVAGQKTSLKPTGKASRIVALSRCKAPRRLSIVISPSRSFLPMKVITMGPAIVSSVVTALGDKLEARLIRLVTAFSQIPIVPVTCACRLPSKMNSDRIRCRPRPMRLGPCARHHVDYSLQCYRILPNHWT